MAREVNVSLTNYNPGTGPASASVDASATWTANDGSAKSGARTGVTLAQLWSRPAITAAVKQAVIEELIWKLLRLDLGIESP